jgi:hypothetical protein
MMRKLLLVSVVWSMCDALAGEFDAARWQKWSPREEIAPSFSLAAGRGGGGEDALKIETRHAFEFGAWKLSVSNLTAVRSYRLTAWYRSKNVPFERQAIAPRIEWFDAQGKSLRPPEYGVAGAEDGGWKRVEISSPAPEKSFAAEIQLGFGFVANAAVLWDDVTLVEEADPADRVVKAVTVFHRPQRTGSASESIESFCRVAERAADQKPDVVCLPEGISVVGTGKSYYEVSEPIPGPATERLGKLARDLRSYVVAGLYERDGAVLYNTAVLIGRDGRLVGKYRKTSIRFSRRISAK